MVKIYRIDRKMCEAAFWYTFDYPMFCAGTAVGRDTCKKDSGGPLYIHMLFDGIKRATQLGIVSAGTEDCRGFGVYTDVMGHIDFIERIVLDADIEVVLPYIDLLDAGCLGNDTLNSWDRSGPDAIRSFEWLAEVYKDSFIISNGALISKSCHLFFPHSKRLLMCSSCSFRGDNGAVDFRKYGIVSTLIPWEEKVE